MSRHAILTFALVLVMGSLFLISIPLYETQAGRSKSIAVLSSSEQVFRETFLTKDATVHFFDNVESFYLLKANGQVDIYDSQYNLKHSIPSQLKSPASIAVGPDGDIYIADNEASQIRTFSSEGRIIKTISVHQPNSIAVLNNGNIVVASPFNGSLLHIYDSSGRKVRSFGTIKQIDPSSNAQNKFLNIGRVLVDLSGTIYYVNEFAPTPTVQRYSQKGKLISEFTVSGDAIDLQKEVAGEFLKRRPRKKVGGIRIINSAAIDPTTNHLWIGMNGASDSGVAYEYKANGKKLREYRFVASSPSYEASTITSVNLLVVRSPFISVFTPGAAFRFGLKDGTSTVAPPIHTNDTCPLAVQFEDCITPCGTEDPTNDRNCKTELLESLNMNGRRIISRVCNSDSTSCLAQVTLCKESNGQQTTHNIQITCNPSGDDDGDSYTEEEGDCDDTDENTYPGAPIGDSGDCGGFSVGFDRNCNGIDDYDEACTPVLVDVLGNGFNLTDAAGGVEFDLNRDGIKERLSWTAVNSDDAWLALDLSGDGQINSGEELFGNYTPQPPSATPNGFLALAEYDKPGNGGNSNGRTDSGDAIFPSLLLWQDKNHNGISEPNELHSLSSVGLASIELDYKESRRRDEHGNWFRYRAKVIDTRGTQLGRWAWDVYLLR
jgi:hypothetical protein